jgi:hypothetical protein
MFDFETVLRESIGGTGLVGSSMIFPIPMRPSPGTQSQFGAKKYFLASFVMINGRNLLSKKRFEYLDWLESHDIPTNYPSKLPVW